MIETLEYLYSASIFSVVFNLEPFQIFLSFIWILLCLLAILIGISDLIKYEFLPRNSKNLTLGKIVDSYNGSGFKGVLFLMTGIFSLFPLIIFYLPVAMALIFFLTWLYRNLTLDHD